MPRSPRGPRPPPRPGENAYSGSSGRDGSCSASHRLTHTHTRSHNNVREMVATIGGNKMEKNPSWGHQTRLFTLHKPVQIVLIFAWLIFNCRASSKLRAEASICTASNGQLEVTELARSDISRRKIEGRKRALRRATDEFLGCRFEAPDGLFQMAPCMADCRVRFFTGKSRRFSHQHA